MTKRTWKKQFEIVNASRDPVEAIDIDGHRVKLSDQNHMATIVDEGLAREIDARYGAHAHTRQANSVIVVPVDDRDPKADKGYRQSFRVPDLSRFKGREPK